ncbi:15468_t:CDS:2 [Entrophospora sp. SA101]|nr:5879_t:CDS:2 [Entrophospora sp. SA101]CAJ0825379.1 10033_t:CDS:2 [Entrophospora sp. SA101]CAJ0839693.1 15468_t:CDS:2 [Entrophospora sp. SA101]
MVSRQAGPINIGKEAKRKEFISPIILLASELEGKIVPANGRVEFIVKFNQFYVCIVETKRESFDQGRAQAYISMETALDINAGKQKVMYGIITNASDWVFLRLTDHGIGESEIYHINSIKSVDGKYYYPVRADVVNILEIHS